MLRAALWHFKKDMRYATRVASQMGNGFGIMLMILGGFSFLQGNIIGGMWWVVIGLFLRNVAQASYQQLLFRDLLKEKPVSDFMRREVIAVPPDISIEECVEDYVYRHHFKMFPVMEADELLGAISVDNIKELARIQWRDTTVRELMKPSDESNTVASSMPADKLLTSMLQPGRPRRYMVVEGGRLVGIISLKDVLELVALKIEIESPDRR